VVNVAAHILSASSVSIALAVLSKWRDRISAEYAAWCPADWVETRGVIPALVLAVHWNILCGIAVCFVVATQLPTTYSACERARTCVAEYLLRAELVGAQCETIRFAFGVTGFMLSPLFMSGPAAVAIVAALLMSTVGVAPVVSYLCLVRSVERAMLEADDRRGTSFGRSPIVLAPTPLSLAVAALRCPVCLEEMGRTDPVAGHHPSGDPVTPHNLLDCKLYHQACLLRWWRSDRTNLGRCPESTVSPRWHRVACSAVL